MNEEINETSYTIGIINVLKISTAFEVAKHSAELIHSSYDNVQYGRMYNVGIT